MRKVLALTSIGALALSLAACSNSSGTSSNGASDAADGIILAYGAEPQNNLLPAMTNETGGGKVIELLYEGLTRYDVSGNTVMAAAESVTTNDGGKTWNAKLKEGLKFSDGSSLTADNFIDAWTWGADPNNGTLNAEIFSVIEGYPEVNDKGEIVGEFSGLTGLQKVSDTEFNIVLTQADPEFDKQLGYSAFYPMPTGSLDSKEAADKQGTEPVSNGPYILKNWENNSVIELVPNPEYQGDVPAKNKGITFKLYTDDSAAYNDLLAGNLDVIDSIPADAAATYEKELGKRAINQESAVWQSFTIPYYLEHFGDDEEGRLRRQAISMAFDRQEICDTIFEGTRSPATDFVAAVVPGHSDNIEGKEVLTYQPEKAKELWAQADKIAPWGDTAFKIAYNADTTGHKEWVEAVLNQVHDTLGIEVEPAPYAQFGEMRDDATNGKLTAAVRSGWQADYPSAYNFMGPIYRAGASANDARYANTNFETTLMNARSQTDEKARFAGYDAAQAILMRDLPAIPLWGMNAQGGYSENVKDVVVNWKSVPVYQDIVEVEK